MDIPKISGDAKTDVRIHFNYTDAEKAFLQDDEHPLNEGKTIKERVEDESIQRFLAWTRKDDLKERKQKEDLEKKRKAEGYII